ncbi:L-threonylcarbamoyladenylate synthase [Granulicoccus phenolivorans]|uniref:L-threonylcarbamoyladenylate synthase n=1 Tax=Granulicoccus phenolivorans TaxID=266854 RepID=UPI0004072EC4|nr:L-threonylcarbamoyladenylate synthase [Granulicoccus phenolivorans]
MTERIVDGRKDRTLAVVSARAAINAGECIVLPTDTVYGIGADAFSAAAVQRLLDAKGRGRDMPPPVLISDRSVLDALARDVPKAAVTLSERFWPGPLTLILWAQQSLRMDLGETRGTIAVRVPDHEIAIDVLQATGPMAVSSANRSGSPAASDVQDAYAQLGDSVSVYLDGGPTPGGQPSTIVDFTASEQGTVVRLGALSMAMLREVVPGIQGPGDDAADDAASAEPAAAGATDAVGTAAPEAAASLATSATANSATATATTGIGSDPAAGDPTIDDLPGTEVVEDPSGDYAYARPRPVAPLVVEDPDGDYAYVRDPVRPHARDRRGPRR